MKARAIVALLVALSFFATTVIAQPVTKEKKEKAKTELKKEKAEKKEVVKEKKAPKEKKEPKVKKAPKEKKEVGS